MTVNQEPYISEKILSVFVLALSYMPDSSSNLRQNCVLYSQE